MVGSNFDSHPRITSGWCKSIRAWNSNFLADPLRPLQFSEITFNFLFFFLEGEVCLRGLDDSCGGPGEELQEPGLNGDRLSKLFVTVKSEVLLSRKDVEKFGNMHRLHIHTSFVLSAKF